MGKAIKPRHQGLQTKFTPKVMDKICDGLAAGKSLRSVCAAKGMPDESSVRRLALTDGFFGPRYLRAREIGAYKMVDDAISIADDATNDYVEREGRNGPFLAVDHENINRSRLRVDTRKWYASKILPSVFGDRLALTGANGGPIKTENKYTMSDDELEAIARGSRR